MKRLVAVPHIAWVTLALVIQLGFYLGLAVVEHQEPIFLRLSITGTVAGILTLARGDIPPGSD